MKLAIFDIDGTLVEGSTEQRFWRYLLTHGHQGPRQILAYVWFLLRYLPTFGRVTTKKNKAYLAGLSAERIEALAASFVAAEIAPRLYEPAVARLQQHVRRGDAVLLISGTLEPLARAVAATLGVEHVRATVCRQRDGHYLAAPPEVHPFGATKLTLATAFATEIGSTLREASAYGDSQHDLVLLAAVGNPVAVLPDGPLLAAARGKRWDIIATRDAAALR